jgi:hypothetical protein
MFLMRQSLGRIFGALALLLAVRIHAGAAEDTCVIVLRSGGVLHGAVTVSGDRYVVTSPNRTIDVQAQQVLLVAASIQSAFEQQRAQLPRDNNDARLRLVEWCLRYRLLAEAEQALADARAIDQFDPRLPMFERRLAVAKKPKTMRSVYQTASAADDSKSSAELAELEALASELPHGTVERFTRKVQPLLVNSCTASGCHESGGKQKFQLDRAVLHGLANRRLTLRNLSAALAYVDRLSPQESELLKMARRNHGGREHAALNPRQVAQLKQLGDWTEHLAGAPGVPAPFPEPRVARAAKLEAVAGVQSHSLPSIPSTFLDRNVDPASHAEQADPQVDAAEPNEQLRPKAKLKFGADLRPWQPQDEFDPEIFNRASQSPDAGEMHGR